MQVLRDGDAVLGEPVAAWTIANLGTIAATGTTGCGIDLVAGGTVNNNYNYPFYLGNQIGQIAGAGGVVIRGRPCDFNNFGTIVASSSAGNGVWLTAGGLFDNTDRQRPSLVEDKARFGVFISGGVGTVENNGTVTTAGPAAVMLSRGGRVFNEQSIVTTNDASGAGVAIAGGAGFVINSVIEARIGVFLEAGGR